MKICRGRSGRCGHDDKLERTSAQSVALLLLKAGAIHVSREQPFMLAAGWASPVYVDCRVLIGKPEVRHAITDLSAAYIGIGHSQRFV